MKERYFPLLLLLSLVLPTSCRHAEKAESPDEDVRVRVTILGEEMIRQPVMTSGKLSSRREMKLGFKTGGIIRQMQAGEGQSLRKGELMASLDLSEIGAEARKARLAFDKAWRDYSRVKNLYEDTVATLAQYQDARTALDLARSNREIAEFNMEHSVIRAPADGKVLRRLMEAGELVSPGYPVFLFASTESEWVVRASLTDRDIVRVAFNDSASLSFDAFPGEVFPGHISEIGNDADPYTGTFEVEIALDRAPASLVSGLLARVELFAGEAKPAIRIPASALVEGTGMEGIVYVIEDNKAVKRKIILEALTDRGLIVRSGLSPGDVLVTEGGAFILDNSRVVVLTD